MPSGSPGKNRPHDLCTFACRAAILYRSACRPTRYRQAVEPSQRILQYAMPAVASAATIATHEALIQRLQDASGDAR